MIHGNNLKISLTQSSGKDLLTESLPEVPGLLAIVEGRGHVMKDLGHFEQ